MLGNRTMLGDITVHVENIILCTKKLILMTIFSVVYKMIYLTYFEFVKSSFKYLISFLSTSSSEVVWLAYWPCNKRLLPEKNDRSVTEGRGIEEVNFLRDIICERLLSHQIHKIYYYSFKINDDTLLSYGIQKIF